MCVFFIRSLFVSILKATKLHWCNQIRSHYRQATQKEFHGKSESNASCYAFKECTSHAIQSNNSRACLHLYGTHNLKRFIVIFEKLLNYNFSYLCISFPFCYVFPLISWHNLNALCAVSTKKNEIINQTFQKNKQLASRFNSHLQKMLFAHRREKKNYLIIYWIDSPVSLCEAWSFSIQTNFISSLLCVLNASEIMEKIAFFTLVFEPTPSTKVKIQVELGVASMLNNFLEERYHYTMWLCKKQRRIVFKTARRSN